MNRNNIYPDFTHLIRRRAGALANVMGSDFFPEVRGNVRFYKTDYGTVVLTEIMGLPRSLGKCDNPIFAFHIHEGGSCHGHMSDPFAHALGHYNPHRCAHPYHAGDMPPLFGANGYAFLAFLSDRFTVDEIIGHTVIIHAGPDDFKTQPSGNSGVKIACGEIISLLR